MAVRPVVASATPAAAIPPALTHAPDAPLLRAPDLALPRAPEVRPVSEERWSVRVTLDSAAKEQLETLKALLSHKIPDGDLGAVLREAIRCGIEKHGNRKGATAPAQQRSAKGDSAGSHIPAAIRREVWSRDGGRCTFEGPDGHRCDSRWQLELDHIRPVALGGSSATDNLRLRCRAHNMLHAEQVIRARAHGAVPEKRSHYRWR